MPGKNGAPYGSASEFPKPLGPKGRARIIDWLNQPTTRVNAQLFGDVIPSDADLHKMSDLKLKAEYGKAYGQINDDPGWLGTVLAAGEAIGGVTSPGAAGAFVGGTDAANAVGLPAFLQWLSSQAFWTRAAEITIGVVVLGVALEKLVKGNK